MNDQPRLSPDLVLEIARLSRPPTIQLLMSEVMSRSESREKDVISLLHELVNSGALNIKRNQGKTSLFERIKTRWPILNKLTFVSMKEPILKGLFFVVTTNLLSWFILLFFPNNPALSPFQFTILGVGFLFLPGFALTLSWYPMGSDLLDFSRLKKENDSDHASRKKKKNGLDWLTRVGYAICYSLGLLILIGFVVGALGQGFNLIIVHGVFTSIEILCIIDVLIKIKHILDPYLD